MRRTPAHQHACRHLPRTAPAHHRERERSVSGACAAHLHMRAGMRTLTDGQHACMHLTLCRVLRHLPPAWWWLGGAAGLWLLLPVLLPVLVLVLVLALALLWERGDDGEGSAYAGMWALRWAGACVRLPANATHSGADGSAALPTHARTHLVCWWCCAALLHAGMVRPTLQLQGGGAGGLVLSSTRAAAAGAARCAAGARAAASVVPWGALRLQNSMAVPSPRPDSPSLVAPFCTLCTLMSSQGRARRAGRGKRTQKGPVCPRLHPRTVPIESQPKPLGDHGRILYLKSTQDT